MSDMENTESNEMLNAAISQITRSKKWTFNNKFKHAYDLLQALKSHDDEIDKQVAKYGKRAIMSLIAIFGGLFGSFFLSAALGSDIVLAIGLVIAAAALVCTVVCFVKRNNAKNQDLSNNFKDTIIPVIDLLIDDINPKGKAKFDIDFFPLESGHKKTNEEELPPGRFIKLKKVTYSNPWCKLELPLTNGSLIKLDITSNLYKFHRKYRSMSGKTKYKSKWKALVEVSAVLFPDSEKLAVDTNLVSGSKIGSIKPGSKGDKNYVQLKKKYKVKQSTPHEEFSCPVKVDDIMHILITLCKSAAKAKGE